MQRRYMKGGSLTSPGLQPTGENVCSVNRYKRWHKMKKTVLIFMLLTILAGCSQESAKVSELTSNTVVSTQVIKQEKTNIKEVEQNTTLPNMDNIVPGEGIGNIVVESSLLNDVMSEYGDKSKVVEGDGYREIKYENSGIDFFCDTDFDETIYKIVLTSPFSGETENGISIGKSTMRDVIQNYGDSQWLTDKDSDTWWCEYSGVNFHVMKYPEYPEDDDKELDKKIVKIEIYRDHE